MMLTLEKKLFLQLWSVRHIGLLVEARVSGAIRYPYATQLLQNKCNHLMAFLSDLIEPL